MKREEDDQNSSVLCSDMFWRSAPLLSRVGPDQPSPASSKRRPESQARATSYVEGGEVTFACRAQNNSEVARFYNVRIVVLISGDTAVVVVRRLLGWSVGLLVGLIH